LAFVPIVAGAFRLLEVAGGPAALPAHPGIAASPLPVVVHIVSAVLFTILGAFQFSPRFLAGWPGWHRLSGRVAAAAGLAVAVSAMWMALFYEGGAHSGALVGVVRLVFGAAMAASILLGVAAIRRSDVDGHRAWMVRGYALGVGAGTQVFTEGFGEPILGTGEISAAAQLAAGWVINLAVAQHIIVRQPRQHLDRRATFRVGAT
jgi:uncharacterized membrane protein